jgi:hypothetical protein
MSDEKWNDNSIQFPRLLCEMNACVEINDDDWGYISQSMDLDIAEVDEILDRANDEWEKIKVGEKPKSYYDNLLKFMAKSCYYAQSHCGDADAWDRPHQNTDRKYLLQCVSYQVACFLAQNTVEGINGVEFEIVLEELADKTLDDNGMMVKACSEWESIIQGHVDALGGWK